jgi:predicted nucleic acid-binding Zn ribbon protein
MFGKRIMDLGFMISDLQKARRRRRGRCANHKSEIINQKSRRQRRRGVLLLVVLSMLVLFLMVGTAFIITAKQSERAAKSARQGAERITGEVNTAELLEDALLQIVRDTHNPYSSLRFHSLLGDKYGNDGLKGEVLTAAWPVAGGTEVTGRQIIELMLNTAPYKLGDMYRNTLDELNRPLQYSPYDDAYNGQVLTFTAGPARGRSTRIVGYVPPAGAQPPRLRILNFELRQGVTVADPTILNGAPMLINGRPFNGTGVGYNMYAASDKPKLNALENIPGVTLLGPSQDPGNPRIPREFPEIALMPHLRYAFGSYGSTPGANTVWLPQAPTGTGGPVDARSYFPLNSSDWNGRGGADESYDAADFQNMLLAYVPAGGELEETTLVDPAATPATLGPIVLPSLHRPDLINHWLNRMGMDNNVPKLASSPAGPMMLRRIMLRPNWWDHPSFSGSNPEYDQLRAAFQTLVETSNQQALAAASHELLKRAIYGPWDVDNDNDGVRDSVWVDVGLPLMTSPATGKLVQPLAAILVMDLDGKLNANTAGSLDLAEVIPPVSDNVRLSSGAAGWASVRRTSAWRPRLARTIFTGCLPAGTRTGRRFR